MTLKKFVNIKSADKEINQSRLVYKRNYEENIGIANNEPITHKHYEDYFIDNINSNMKTEVDGFIDTLATIANDENAYQNIKTLVEDSAKDIWDEAVSFVQSNINTTPDDRPLYWARNKMQVALKSHVYFENQFLFSEVTKGSELEKMVQLFEEKSRNYTGVDFSSSNSALNSYSVINEWSTLVISISETLYFQFKKSIVCFKEVLYRFKVPGANS